MTRKASLAIHGNGFDYWSSRPISWLNFLFSSAQHYESVYCERIARFLLQTYGRSYGHLGKVVQHAYNRSL